MPASAPSSIRLGRFRRLPRRDTRSWQGGIVRIPTWAESPSGGAPYRPWGAVWVARPEGLVWVNVAESPDRPGAEFAADVLVDLALRYQDQLIGRPGRIEVEDASLGAAVVALLGDPDVAVDVVADLTEVKAFVFELARSEQENSPVPELLSGRGVTVADVREFADAAARFYRAEPWLHLVNDDLLTVQMPGLDRRVRYASVMGNAGLQFGVAFFTSLHDVESISNGTGGLDARRTYWSVTFSRQDETPPADLALWDQEGLALAADGAYPVPLGYGPGDRFTRPTRTLLGQFTAVLTALAESREDEMDGGRWVKHVQTSRGPIDVALTLPHIVEETAGSAARSPGSDRRGGERAHAEIHRFLAGKEFASLKDMNAAVSREFSGRMLDDRPRAALTPGEQAQDLAYQAFEAVGRRRVILARQALALWPDCADAYVILAESAAGPSRALPLYEAAVAAGARALGEECFRQCAGHFWGLVETRPYMRALLGLSETLVALGRVDDAVAQLRELLRLNPNDNLGGRYRLLLEFVRSRRDDEARALLLEYKDDPSAEWVYTWALLEFHAGARDEADRRLNAALDANPHVPTMLEVERTLLPPPHDSISFGGPDEALSYVNAFGDVWRETPGAVEWLRRAAGKARRGTGSGGRLRR